MARLPWIRFDISTLDDPRLIEVAEDYANRFYICPTAHDGAPGEELDETRAALHARNVTRGAIVTLWCYAHDHIDVTDTLHCSPEAIDHLVGIEGFCSMLPDKWIEVAEDGRSVRLPGYCAKSGLIAKRKEASDGAVRQRAYRERQKLKNRNGNGDSNVTRDTPVIVTSPVTLDIDKDKDKEIGDKSPTKKVAKQLRLVEAELTPGLNREAWQTWLQYRIEIRKPLQPASLVKAAEAMAQLGSHAEQLEAVEYTIGQGYQGLVARPRTATPRAWPARSTQESALAAIDAASHDDTPNGSDSDLFATLHQRVSE